MSDAMVETPPSGLRCSVRVKTSSSPSVTPERSWMPKSTSRKQSPKNSANGKGPVACLSSQAQSPPAAPFTRQVSEAGTIEKSLEASSFQKQQAGQEESSMTREEQTEPEELATAEQSRQASQAQSQQVDSVEVPTNNHQSHQGFQLQNQHVTAEEVSTNGQSRVTASEQQPQVEAQEAETLIKSIEGPSSADTPKIEVEKSDVRATIEESPCPEGQLKRKREQNDYSDPLDKALAPLTADERKAWRGWVELESDPEHFNHIIREYGIQAVNVKEALGLDDELMSYIPKPILGMIFLYSYLDDEDEPEDGHCPSHVWFANQTIENACATIAIMNIVMNVPGLKLGKNLQAFKTETTPLHPARRGHKLGEDSFIRGIHNTFARKADIINSDLCVSNAHDEWVKKQKNKNKTQPKRKSNTHLNKKRKVDTKKNSEPAYHFVTYVPVAGQIWRLDGLQKYPLCLGDASEDWVKTATSDIQARIAAYGSDELRFNLLCLTGVDQYNDAVDALAVNLKSIQAVEELLNEMIPDWKAFMDGPRIGSIKDIAPSAGLTPGDLAIVFVPNATKQQIEQSREDPMALMDLYRALSKHHRELMSKYLEAVAGIDTSDANVLSRTRDNSPLIYNAMKALSDNGDLEVGAKVCRLRDDFDELS